IGTKTSPYPVIVDYTKLKNHFYGTGADEEKFVLDLGDLPEETEGIYFAIYSIFVKYGFIDKASGPCKYYVPFAGDPELGVNVESEINATKEIVYDWEITKAVEPEAMELEEDASGTFEYTLKATRTKVDEIDNYSASGTLTVFNTGPVEDPGVVATVTVQYKDGTEWKELKEEGIIGSPGISIEASNTTGYGYRFTISFDPGSYTEIRILATAKDAYSYTAEDHNDHSLSGLTPEVTDESATVIDEYTNLIDFEGEGFTVESDAAWPWELNDVTGGTKTYTATITNTGAPKGSYSLTNKATLTENDTLEERIANARILITVPDPQVNTPSIEASVSHTVAWERETKYDWEIDKSVEPTSVTLDSSDSTELKYTILANRLEPSVTSTYTVTGRATATNNGNVDLKDVVIGVTLDSEEATSLLGDLAIGDQEGFDFTFEADSDFDPFTVTVTATGTAGVEVTDTDSYDATAPQEPTPDSIEDATSTIEDKRTNLPAGFSLDPDVITRNWDITETSTEITYKATLTNENASAEGSPYYLTNEATLTEYNTKETRVDDATVIINVPSPYLDVVTSAVVNWERKIVYDWELQNSVVPTKTTLDIGDWENLDYTLLATRTIDSSDSTFTISGTIVVENNGAGLASGVVVKAELFGIETKTLSGASNISAGASESYNFSFVTKIGQSSYTVNAIVSSDDGGALDSITKNKPTNPSPNERIDEEASVVADKFWFTLGTTPSEAFGTSLSVNNSAPPGNEFIVLADYNEYGFELKTNEPNPSNPWNVGDVVSGTISHPATVTNKSAVPGIYFVSNLATLTENDTGQKRPDDANTLEIHVLSPEISAEVTANINWEREMEYDWELGKTVNPTETTLGIGDSEYLNYTLVATRVKVSEDSTYTINGNVKVTNSGSGKATGVVVKAELLGNEKTLAGATEIPGTGDWTYNFSFITDASQTSYTVIATVTTTNNGSATDSDTVNKPNTPDSDSVEDESASVEDTLDDITGLGFSITGYPTNWPWSITNQSTGTRKYTLTLENVSAEPGTYYLTNNATLTESDNTDQKDYADAEVKINVPSYVDLDVVLNSNVTWEEEIVYNWLVEKTVNPTEVTLPVGESILLDYTITATKNIASSDSTYTISGTVTVTNSGNIGATGV
ncbi:MAG: hypothetical protein ACP5D6_10010, partial [Kosmotogaceae bacterium]